VYQYLETASPEYARLRRDIPRAIRGNHCGCYYDKKNFTAEKMADMINKVLDEEKVRWRHILRTNDGGETQKLANYSFKKGQGKLFKMNQIPRTPDTERVLKAIKAKIPFCKDMRIDEFLTDKIEDIFDCDEILRGDEKSKCELVNNFVRLPYKPTEYESERVKRGIVDDNEYTDRRKIIRSQINHYHQQTIIKEMIESSKIWRDNYQAAILDSNLSQQVKIEKLFEKILEWKNIDERNALLTGVKLIYKTNFKIEKLKSNLSDYIEKNYYSKVYDLDFYHNEFLLSKAYTKLYQNNTKGNVSNITKDYQLEKAIKVWKVDVKK
jgi:hypothetical protein